MVDAAGGPGPRPDSRDEVSRLEAALRESEERLRTFTRSVPDATFTIDEQSRILYANDAVRTVFGYDPKDVVGRRLTMLMPERYRLAHESGLNRFLRTGRRGIPWTGVELPGLHRDGHEIPLEITFGTYEADGRRYFTGVAREISGRLAIDNALLYTDVEKADRAKSDFLAVVSHELRTPLNSITGYADLLAGGVTGPLSEQQQRQVERIAVCARHLGVLIDEILTYARLDVGRERVEFAPADAGAIAREVAALAKPRAEEKGLRFLVDVPEQGPEFVTDALKVRQILVNLLHNAVKYTERGQVELAVRPASDGVEFAVRDTGIGIAPEDRERIFQPFQQVQSPDTRTSGGTGLGLSIVRALLEVLGGQIELESQPGQGSTFTVRIPATPPRAR